MSAPYLAATANANLGSAALIATVSASTALGDTIAVWLTSNTAASNLSGVIDSQGNAYAAQGAAADGTNVNGQWFVAGPSNNPLGPKALAAGTDTITGQYTGTGGSKTLDAIGCSGLTGNADEISGPQTGAGAALSYSTPASTVGNDLVLAGEIHNLAGGQPVTYGGTFATPALSNQAAPNHPAGDGFTSYAAAVLVAPGAITTSATFQASANWASATIALAPINASSSKARIGATIPNLALRSGSGCYDDGMSQAAADSAFCGFVGRGIGPLKNHLSVTKKFWTQVNNYSLTINDLANYLAFGTKILFAITPPLSGGTSADQTLLANFLSALKAQGWNATNAVIIPWQEPEGNTHFGAPGGGGPAAYQAAMAFFGPVINASGLPLAQDVGLGGGEATATSYLNAGYAASGVHFQAQYADYYFGPFSRGIRLATSAAIADANGVPFGVGEFGMHVTDDYASYMNYLTGFFQARLVATNPVKPIADLEYYQGQCSATGAGDLTSPILTATDPRAPYFRAMFDTLTTVQQPNTITVASPGNQSGTAGVAIAPLTITATDSDSSQTLTFSAAGLPTGLVISGAGVITGTPTVQGTYAVTITATDGTGASGSTGFSWVISPIVTNTITVTNPGTQSSLLGAAVSKQITATDSNPAISTFTWQAAGLPPGLVISASSGTITGITTGAAAVYNVTVTATDTTGSSGTTTFAWQVTSPNILTAGQFITLPPLTPTPIAGLGPADQLSYEIVFGLVAGAGSSQPFTAVTLQFFDFDSLPTLQSPVATVTWRCPMGAHNDPNGPAIIYGRGPMRGAFMRIRANNTDSVDGTLAFMTVVGTARTVERDIWGWDSGGNAPVIPGYTNSVAATASLVLGGIAGATVAASGNDSVLCSMFAGQVSLRAHYGAGASSVQVSVAPQPPALFSNQSLFNEPLTAGNELLHTIALPRGPCVLKVSNNDGANAATSVFAEIIAIET